MTRNANHISRLSPQRGDNSGVALRLDSRIVVSLIRQFFYALSRKLGWGFASQTILHALRAKLFVEFGVGFEDRIISALPRQLVTEFANLKIVQSLTAQLDERRLQ